jgi:hypothetical protein
MQDRCRCHLSSSSLSFIDFLFSSTGTFFVDSTISPSSDLEFALFSLRQLIIHTMASNSNTYHFDYGPDAFMYQSIPMRAPPAPRPPSDTKTGAPLGLDFQPSDYSVICGRGKESFNHVGNRRFRILTSMSMERYSRTDNNKATKSAIVSEIVAIVRQAGGNFCKYKRGEWYEVGDYYAREKVSSLLRDLLHTQYRSSAKAKIARRPRKQRNKDQNQQAGLKQLAEARNVTEC